MQHSYGQPPPAAAGPAHSLSGPPTKRLKSGGMITTKYAPPPGYVPPVVPPTPYAAWSAPPYAQHAYYPYNQQGYAPYGQYAHPGYYQHPAASPYPVAAYQPYQQHPAYTQAIVPHAAPQNVPVYGSSASAPQNLAENAARHRHNSVQDANPRQSSTISKPGPNDELDESHPDYCEFTRPCYYAFRESEIVKELSIGLVHMKTPNPTSKALPATWNEASDTVPNLGLEKGSEGNGCASTYHADENKHEELKPVSETARWEQIKDDHIFSSFLADASTLVEPERLREEYLNRPDQDWLENRPRRSIVQLPQASKMTSAPLDIPPPASKKRVFSQIDAPKNENESDLQAVEERRASQQHDREDRTISQHLPHGVEPNKVDIMQNRQQHETQEEILARLGVTGPPKPAVRPPQAVDTIGLHGNGQHNHANVPASRPTSENKTEKLSVTPAVHKVDIAQEGKQTNIARKRSIEVTPEPIRLQETIPDNPNESRYTRLAREYQLGNKRSLDESDQQKTDSTKEDINGHQDKRRK